METCLPMKSVALVLTTGNREKINQTRAENKIGQVGPCYEKRAGNSCTKRKPKLKPTGDRSDARTCNVLTLPFCFCKYYYQSY